MAIHNTEIKLMHQYLFVSVSLVPIKIGTSHHILFREPKYYSFSFA